MENRPTVLTGKELLDKIKKLSHLPRRETAKACGYYTTSKDGQVRVKLTDFYKAALAAQGTVVDPSAGKEGRGREATFRVSVHKSGQIVIGSTYTQEMGLEVGDEFEIKLGYKHIHLKKISEEEYDDQESTAPSFV